MGRITRIELAKEDFKFSSGHFTIFSATERENIHGHNFTVSMAFDSEVDDNGMVFDYGEAKDFIRSICRGLHEFFLLPEHCKHIEIHKEDDYTFVHFNGEKIPFLERDIKILPLQNITLEELSTYFVDKFVDEFVKAQGQPVTYVEAKVFSGPGQSANAIWKKQEKA